MYQRSILASIFILLLHSGITLGQISHGGAPLMNTADFNAARVLYLLEPEDPIILEGLKSANKTNGVKALNFATERPVDLSPDANGEWVEKGGLRIWRAHLISPGAYSVGTLFSEFELVEGVRLFLYDPMGTTIMGSYTSENNKAFGSFYVGHIPGEEVVVELQVPVSSPGYGRLRIGLLSHAFLPVYARKSVGNTGLGTSQVCEIDINCNEGEEWQIIKQSVCHISTPTLLCTGVLINNTAYDGKPYILTAEHCINKEFYAKSSVFYFGYENSECGLVDGRRNQSVSGANLIATGDSLDFTLVQLTSKAPREYEVYYAGWDIREQNHSSSYVLHHPNADAMKISVDFDATNDATSVPGDLSDYLLESNYHIRQWDVGTTEGGSSGGPLFNASKRVIGLLSGGLAKCGDSIGYDEQSDRTIFSLTKNVNDYFSKLYYNWDYYSEPAKQLKRWLDPINTGQLSIGGLSYNSVNVEQRIRQQNQLVVYPNPSHDEVTLTLPETSGKIESYSIYDVTGKLMKNLPLHSTFPVTINIAELDPGIYLVKVHGEREDYSARIIVK